MVKEDKVFVCNACLCCVQGIYTDTSDCFGFDAKQTCLCIDTKARGLKECNAKGPKYFVLNASEVDVEFPRTLLKQRNQCFCYFNACSLPCDGSNAPSAISFLRGARVSRVKPRPKSASQVLHAVPKARARPLQEAQRDSAQGGHGRRAPGGGRRGPRGARVAHAALDLARVVTLLLLLPPAEVGASFCKLMLLHRFKEARSCPLWQ